MYFINNMKIEKIILIGIIIILSILVIRYFINNNYYENFENNEEYGVIHMTNSKLSDFNNNEDSKIHYIWSNFIQSYKDVKTPRILITSFPPTDLKLNTNSTNTIDKIDILPSETNDKLDKLLPDTRFIGSMISLNNDNVNNVKDTELPLVLRCNNLDNLSIFGSNVNKQSFYNISNFELIGNLGSVDDSNIEIIKGMNIDFPDSNSNRFDKIKAIEKKNILQKIIKDEAIINNGSFISIIEKFLMKQLINLEENNLDKIRNKIKIRIIDTVLLDQNIETDSKNKKYYGDDSYLKCVDSTTSIICSKKKIYDKLYNYIINNGYYKEMPFNFNGAIKIINDLANKIINLRLYNDNIGNNILFSDIYKGAVTDLHFYNEDNQKNNSISGKYPFLNNKYEIKIPPLTTDKNIYLKIKIPIGSVVKFCIHDNNEESGFYEITFSRDKLSYLIENFTDKNLFQYNESTGQGINVDIINHYEPSVFSININPSNHENVFFNNKVNNHQYFRGKIFLKRSNLLSKNNWSGSQLFYLEINMIPVYIRQGYGQRIKKIIVRPEENIIQKMKTYDKFISSYNKHNFVEKSNKIFYEYSDSQKDIRRSTTVDHNISVKPSNNYMFLPQHKMSYIFYNNRLKIYRSLKHIAKYFINENEVYTLSTKKYSSEHNKIRKFVDSINIIDDTKINFYKIKNSKIPNKHISLGDIAILNKFNDESKEKIFKKFATIPIHCYKEVRNWEETDKVFEQLSPYLAIYKNEYTNTFKVINKKNTLPDGKVGMIIPCPDHNYYIDDLIKDNNKAILKCRKYNNMKEENPLLTSSEKDDPINVSLNKKIYNQEKKITLLKEYADRLRQENSKGVIINREYNRSRMNNYLQNQKNSLDNAVDKLIDSNNKVDININYKIQLLDKITNYVIEASNEEVPFEKKKVLVKKIQEVKKISLHGDKAEKKIEEILQECPTFNMEGYFKRDPPCLGCTIPRDQE